MAAGASNWLACLIAALLEDRDILRGPPNDLPASLALRLELLLDDEPRTREIRNAKRRAHDLARRAGIEAGVAVDVDEAGSILALAYPDRVARNRNGTTAGQFRLTDGSSAWLPASDALASTPALVFAESDGNKRSARIRLAAPLREL
jgi:ATP-dependent helicase HrpB